VLVQSVKHVQTNIEPYRSRLNAAPSLKNLTVHDGINLRDGSSESPLRSLEFVSCK
jgi:hypothetical protein